MPGSSLGLTVPVDIPPFHFQPRRVGVDWRRFSAIDVERVAREVDVAALQEHIAAVTFCDLDGERCPHCRQPADPVLLKVLRMAQLSLEYLLHCQQHLSTSLAVHAQHLRAARAELACTWQQAAGQAAQLRGAKEESRRWKKLVATQQFLLRAGPNTYCEVRGGKASGVESASPRRMLFAASRLCSPAAVTPEAVKSQNQKSIVLVTIKQVFFIVVRDTGGFAPPNVCTAQG